MAKLNSRQRRRTKNTHMNNSRKGWVLVFIQFLCLGVLMGWPPAFPFSLAGKAISGTGILLGIWAILAMPPSSLSFHPKPRASGKFTSKGPYRLIRHPMYGAVIIVAIAQLYDYPNQKNIFALGLLIITLWAKIMLEEKFLADKYAGYAGYKNSTKKLIPFIW
jgi:protein-S-isoprenylcysteine O-methyltransferase Ste14